MCDVHEELLFYGLPQFKQRLLRWLAWFNAERPHRSLQPQIPLVVLARHSGPQCRKSWPNTQSLQGVAFRPNSGRGERAAISLGPAQPLSSASSTPAADPPRTLGLMRQLVHVLCDGEPRRCKHE